MTSNDSDLAPARPIIEGVRPRVDDGRFDAKATIGDAVNVQADAFLDGHDHLRVELRYRHDSSRAWKTELMQPLGNDRWSAYFTPKKFGRYQFAVRACVDHFDSWMHDIRARSSAGQDLSVELLVGAGLAEQAANNAKGADRERLQASVADIKQGYLPDPAELEDSLIAELVTRHLGDTVWAESGQYGVRVERERARFSTWYELFPRSTGKSAKKHGTFRDVIDRLDYVDQLGADILYLPPIHPIGTTARKGRNNAPKAKKGDTGSPWAIGSAQGGHTGIHPDLGTMEDFEKLIETATGHGIEIALDLAYQCSPDHPWVSEHPEWFKHRPDGTIRYAENPPKKYEDVYPIDFETSDWRALWAALREVVEFWIEHGVRVFRVDNPHTKPFAFWAWLIPEIQAKHGDIIFLAEAFTRPKIMQRLAKLGFTQSYTYFAWRTQKWEIEQYLKELTKTDVVDYFRPNFWPNTPDILTEQLQEGNRAMFMVRGLLAATLTASYGIYGPVFELCETAPRHKGSEEYHDGEKYQIRHYDLEASTSIAPFLSRVNAIRKGQLALQHDRGLEFHWTDNDQLLVYSKTVPPGAHQPKGVDPSPIVVIANLDTTHEQSAWIDLRLDVLGLADDASYVVHDLLTDARYEWQGRRNYVILNPTVATAHVFRIESTELPA